MTRFHPLVGIPRRKVAAKNDNPKHCAKQVPSRLQGCFPQSACRGENIPLQLTTVSATAFEKQGWLHI